MNIKNKIDEITATLKWQVLHVQGTRDLEITSDPWEQTHTIHVPQEGADWRDIEYLHELAHATLAEKHHLLSTGWFSRSAKKSDYEQLTNPIRVASDWFADDLLVQWCPDGEKAEIREHAGYAVAYQEHDIDMLFGGGLAIAQAVQYLGNKIHTIPRRYRKIVDVLLAVDPSRPSVAAKCNLINALAALTCPLRVALTNEEEKDVWKIRREK